MNIYDFVNPPGRFLNGNLAESYNAKDVLPLSGRKIPEFANRRSIREMFLKGGERTVEIAKSSEISQLSSQNTQRKEEVAGTKFVKTAISQKDPPASISSKRSGAGASPSKRPLKRSKSNTSRSTKVIPSGQKSLAGFFKPKINTNNDLTELHSPNSPGQDSQQMLGASVSEFHSILTKSSDQPHGTIESLKSETPEVHSDSFNQPHELIESSFSSSGMRTDFSSQSHDLLESKMSWSRLFTKPPPPRCQDHDEPCLRMTTRKQGANQGRAFWMCSRPLGPSGEKERGTEWRCRSFIWCSDWK